MARAFGRRDGPGLDGAPPAHPVGPALVALAGLAAIGFGGYQLYKAYQGRFREELDAGLIDEATVAWVVRLGRATPRWASSSPSPWPSSGI